MRQTNSGSQPSSATLAPELCRQDAFTFTHATPLGPMHSCWTESGLYSLTWVDSEPSASHVREAENSYPAVGMLDDGLGEYFQGGEADFRSIPLDDRGWTPFTRSVYEFCREISPGTTLTYRELADRAGNGSASRAVGAAMARNRILLVIPCHRVVSRGGNLRGFSGPGGIQTKQFLLDLEAA